MKKEQEVMVDGKKVTIYVTKPSNEVMSNADIHRAKVWHKCIRNEVMTKKELKAFMEKNNKWDKEKSDKEEDIGKKITDLEKTLYRG